MTTAPDLDAASPFFHEQRAGLVAWPERDIVLCGVGAVGGQLAETLARMGCPRLRLIDDDAVVVRNLSTQPYSRPDVGAPKVRALGATLYRAVGARVTTHEKRLTPDNAAALLVDAALVVDCFDNAASRAAVQAACAEGLPGPETPCLHVGFAEDGRYGSALWDPGYIVPRDGIGDPCDYPLTRPFLLLLVALAARAVVEHTAGQHADYEVTGGDLRVSRLPR